MGFWEKVAAGVAAVFGTGGVATVIVAWIQSRQSKANADNATTTQALDLVERSREDTGRFTTQWAECERRCQELGRIVADLRERLGRMEAHARDQDQRLAEQDDRLREKDRRIMELESDSRSMRRDLRELRDSTPPAKGGR